MPTRPPDKMIEYGGEFSANEWLRYTRHIQLDNFGAAGQKRLKNATVLIVGAGGLGSPVSLYLAAAGVGKLIIMDNDRVDRSNLQRQIIFTEQDIGQSKALCAQRRLQALNSDINIEAIDAALSADNAQTLIEASDLVLDCTDNFATRYLINDKCHATATPWLFASIDRYAGQCSLFLPGQACFRCLFPQPPKNTGDCNSNGVLGVVPGLLGTMQANEAIRYLTQKPCGSAGNLLLFEASDLSIRTIKLQTNPHCKLCQAPNDSETTFENDTEENACDTPEKENDTEISAKQFAQLIDNKEEYLLLDVRTKEERFAFHMGGMHIPLDQLSGKIQQLPTNKKIICYCQSGVRSKEAEKILSENNISGLSLINGLAEWIRFHQTKNS